MRVGKTMLKLFNNERGSASIEALLVLPILLILIALFAQVIKINIGRTVIAHAALCKGVKDSVGLSLDSYDDSIVRNNRQWLGVKESNFSSEVNGKVMKVFANGSMSVDLPMIGNKKKVVQSILYIPVFNDMFGTGANGLSSIWELSPFERGRAIENVFGNNLPDKFEVLDILTSDGEGTSIMSIDTTARTYANDEVLYEEIVERIDRLADFQGDEDGEIQVDASDIKTRKLLVIIPSNGLTDVQKEQVAKAEAYAVSRGIMFEIVEYQEKAVG